MTELSQFCHIDNFVSNLPNRQFDMADGVENCHMDIGQAINAIRKRKLGVLVTDCDVMTLFF